MTRGRGDNGAEVTGAEVVGTEVTRGRGASGAEVSVNHTMLAALLFYCNFLRRSLSKV